MSTLPLRRFIAIEHNSGFIWGDAISQTPERACTLIDLRASGQYGRDFESVYPIRDTGGGFHVYEVAADFPEIGDGSDQEMIERVTTEGKHIGDFRAVAEDDDYEP
jgi:hypothetical protein